MDNRQPSFFTAERQRRPSPRAASAEHASSSSSPSYPSGQGSATTPASGSYGSAEDRTGERALGGGNGGAAPAESPGRAGHHQPHSAPATTTADHLARTPPHHHHQHNQRDHHRHPRSASTTHTAGGTFLDTTAFASQTSPLTSSMEYGRAMAHLLDSVASPSTTSPFRTPPRSSSVSARRQPPHAAQYEQGVQQQQQQQPSRRQQQQQRPNADSTWESASPAAASHAAAVGRQPTHTVNVGGRPSPAVNASHRTAAAAAPAPAGPRHRQQATSDFADASIASSNRSGDADDSSQLSSTPMTDRHSSNWASPSEVLQLRALCQDMVSRYQRELDHLSVELRQAQEECAAYARERARVRELQKSYEDGAAAVTRAKAQQSQWEEERALLQLRVEKMVVENQRLQLLLTKKRHLHGPQQLEQHQRQQQQHPFLSPPAGVDTSAARGAGAGSRERVRAAVRAVMSNAHTLRTPSASWPPLPAAAATAATPATMTTTPTATTTITTTTLRTTSDSLTSTNLDPDGGQDATFLSPSAAAGGGAGKLSAPVGRCLSAMHESNTSPLTLLSPASSASPEAAQYNARLRAASGSSPSPSGAAAAAMIADTPLPLVSPPSTAVTALSLSPATSARPAGAAVAGVSGGAPGAPSHSAGSAGEEEEGYGMPSASLPQGQPGEARQEEDPHTSSLMTPSLSNSSEGPTSRSTGAGAGGGAGVARAGAVGAAWSQRPRGSVEGVGRQRADADEVGDSAMGDGEFDPSYARGATDVSSTSAVSSPAPGVMMEATAENRSCSSGSSDSGSSRRRPRTGEVDDGLATAGTNSSSSPTTDALHGATCTTTTTTEAAGGRARRAPAAPIGGVSPSLGSTADGSGTATSASATTTWSLQYLYQLPRTPAEALEEELRMLKELQRLTEENRLLEARLAQATAMGDMNADQHAQQRLELTQAQQQARRTAAQWELTSKQLESEVSHLQLQCAEAKAAVEEVLERAREQQVQQRVRVVELEADCRAAVMAAREEAVVKIGALRLSLREVSSAAAATPPAASSVAATMEEVKELRAVAAERQETVARLQAELHTLRGSHAALQDQHAALRTDSHMRHVHVEGELASARDMLAEAARTQNELECRVEVLEAEVERLRTGTVASEGCMTVMEERLRLVTGELATQQERLDEAAQWQARAVSAEEELQTQRRYYEKEIGVYKTAACAMQDKHHTTMADLAKRYERLRMRYEGAKVRLATAVSKSGAAALFSGRAKGHTHGAVNGSPSPRSADGEAPVNTSGNSVNNAAGVSRSSASRDAPAASIVADAVPRRAVSSFDILHALQSSAQATEQLTRSLNRATSPYRAR